jgi:hypothetical protein
MAVKSSIATCWFDVDAIALTHPAPVPHPIEGISVLP